MQSDTKYNYGWRILHWLIAVLVLALIPVGLGMASGDEASFWKVLTDRLYNWHKAIGFAVLWLMVLRIAVKSTLTAPPYPGELSPTLVLFAKWLHHFMYMLLVMAPLIGWAGVTAYPRDERLIIQKEASRPLFEDQHSIGDRLVQLDFLLDHDIFGPVVLGFDLCGEFFRCVARSQ